MTEPTKKEAYQELKASGEDLSLQKEVAKTIAEVGPMTTHEIAGEFPSREKNGIRPRVTELVQMGCLRREGTRMNPSGNEAAVHHLTSLGWSYLLGRADPDPKPSVSELQTQAVDVARQYLREEVNRAELAMAVERVDEMKSRMDPDK